MMNRVLVELTTIATILGTATAAGAQTALASDESPFRFQLEQSESPRGLVVEGYVYNALPSRITNVRLQVDSIDAHGTLITSASGWVPGDVAAGGRSYFYVPVSAQAATYRPSAQRFDKVMLEAPAPDAAANLAGGPRISTADSPASVWVVPTNEDLMIARHTLVRTRP